MDTSSDPVEMLRRWTDVGGVWRVSGRRGDTLVVGLYRCDGGEEIDRFETLERAVVDLVERLG